MTPEDLSARHPRLFHVTLPSALSGIRAHGLLPTSQLLDLFEVHGSARARLEHSVRPKAVAIHHARHGTVLINDQKPMTEAALLKCLDGGLTPRDWLALLNRRIFFWCDEEGLARLLGARANRTRALVVIVLDTMRLATAYAHKIELSPINSGSTLRKPARRGSSTFTPMRELSYDAWSRKRGGRDRIREVTVLDGITDIAQFVVETRDIPASGR
jgi:hypothetical protein